ncbi:MAG: cellulase family glycosylhydrolase [Dehalococcoidia bacterium]|nr:cellulase family glycosylhydrolase [Dehalococcoidia bacterium]
MAPRSLRVPALARSAAAFLVLLGSLLFDPGSPPSAHAAARYSATPDGRLVGPDGKPFFMLGFNYEGPLDRAWKMWEDRNWDPARIDADLGRAARIGLNTVRMFIQAPLPREIEAGNFKKLDTFLDLAAKHRLAVIVTLYDYNEDDLTKVASVAQKIAERYRNRPEILAYDLKNEPKYANLVLARYPAGVTPPLLTGALIAHYGERMPLAEADSWREGAGKALSPARFTREQVYWQANNYKLYLEFLADAATWTAKGEERSTGDYLDSPESGKWKPFLAAYSATLAAWLAPQIAAIRSADPTRLVTVGYNDPILAKLPANEPLTLLSMHRYPATTLKSVRANLLVLESMRRSFPGRPIALTEFGWSTAEVDPHDSAVLETATWLSLWHAGHAGGLKWMLDDLPPVGNPREDHFGFFRTDGTPKPIVTATMALAAYLLRGERKPGDLLLEAEGAGLRYRYTSANLAFYGGRQVGDQRLTAKSASTTQVFLAWNDHLRGRVTAPTDLEIAVSRFTGAPLDPAAVVQRSGAPVSARRQGERLLFSADPGAEFRVLPPFAGLESRIQIVWPHGNAPVTQASRANVGVYLFEKGSKRIACPADPNAVVRLWRSVNAGIEEPIATGVRRTERVGEMLFPSWAFNDIDVSPARDPATKIFFRVSVDGTAASSNVWSHGADARTIFPQPDVPTGAEGIPSAVDAKIQIVWPHGNAPVAAATKANIAAYLFHRGTGMSVGLDWSPTVRLWRAVGSASFEAVATGIRTTQQAGGVTFPVWVFNDIDVSPARNPSIPVYFRVTVDGVDSRSNIWSHAADARTIFPQPDIPTDVLNCE